MNTKPIPAIQKINELVDTAFTAGMMYMSEKSDEEMQLIQETKAEVKTKLNAELLNERERTLQEVEKLIIWKDGEEAYIDYKKFHRLAELKEGGE